MGTIVPTTFTRYSMTEEEQMQNSVLSELQLQLIQNERANIAEQILGLKLDPVSPGDFMQQESFLKGQLMILGYIIDRSVAAVTALNKISGTN